MRNIIFIVSLFLSLLADAQSTSPMRLAHIGDSLKNAHDYRKAIEYYNQIDDATRINTAYLSKKFGLATCYKELGEFDKAIEIYQTLINNGKRTNSAKINLANTYNLTGRYEEALLILTTTDLSSDGDKRIFTQGNVYLNLGMDDQAVELFDSIMRQDNLDKSLYYVAYNGKGRILLSKGRYSEAAHLFQEVTDYYSADNPRRYQAMGNLALAKGLSDEPGNALQLIDEALNWQACHFGKQHFDYIKCLNKKAQILQALGAKKEAIATFREYFCRERDNILRYFSTMTERERLAYWKSKRKDIAMCYTLENDAPELLYEVSLFSKNIMILANCNFRQLVAKDAKTAILYERLEELRRKQKAIEDKTVFEQLDRNAENLEKALVSICDMYAAFKKDILISVSDIKKNLPNRNDVAIEFVNYEKGSLGRYAALVLKKEGKVTFCPLFTDEFLTKKTIGSSIAAIVDGDNYSTKDKLYRSKLIANTIWSPITKNLPSVGKIYFAPDGILHKLAIEYMCDSVTNGRNAKDIYRLSSTRTLTLRSEKISGKMLLVGGIDFDDMSQMASNYDVDRNTSDLLRREKMPPANGTPYPPLYGSHSETDSIASKVTMYKVDVMQNSEATEDSIKSILGNYDVAHIATHGYTYQKPDENAEESESSADLSAYRSGIVLAGANAASSMWISDKEDGILSASEISELHLDGLELIVLSACQTALGEVSEKGEGPIGLVRGLKKAGAKQIIASLWEVSDEATLNLMTAFYKALSKGILPHTALINAQKELRDMEKTEEIKVFNKQQKHYVSKGYKTTKPYNRPCYWAPFIIIDSLN